MNKELKEDFAKVMQELLSVYKGERFWRDDELIEETIKAYKKVCAEEQQKELLKKHCTGFFYWWYNQPGNNTEQGFEEWYNQNIKDNGNR